MNFSKWLYFCFVLYTNILMQYRDRLELFVMLTKLLICFNYATNTNIYELHIRKLYKMKILLYTT